MIWASVPNYPNYEVSECGSVRNKRTGKILRTDWGGRSRLRYRYVRLFKDGKSFHTSVHRTVYLAFIGEIPEGMHIDHIDRDNLNNHVDNLRCTTPKENNDNRCVSCKVYTEEDFKTMEF